MHKKYETGIKQKADENAGVGGWLYIIYIKTKKKPYQCCPTLIFGAAVYPIHIPEYKLFHCVHCIELKQKKRLLFSSYYEADL